MKLLEILDREGVLPVLAGRDKRSVLAELAAAAAARSEGAVDAAAMLDAFVERESQGSTGIGDGIAVPHGKVNLTRVIAVVGRSPEGVSFGDKEPSRLFFALAIPRGKPGCHLAALARIARLTKSESFRRRLLDAADGDALFAALGEEDAKP